MKKNLAQMIKAIGTVEKGVLAEKALAFAAKVADQVSFTPKGKKEKVGVEEEVAALVEAIGLLNKANGVIEGALEILKKDLQEKVEELGTYRGEYAKVSVYETDKIEIEDSYKLAKIVGLEKFLSGVVVRPTKKLLEIAKGPKARKLVKVEKVVGLRVMKP